MTREHQTFSLTDCRSPSARWPLGRPCGGGPLMPPMGAKQIGRCGLLVLVGVAAFLLNPSHRGPWTAVAHSHGGSFAVSFAVSLLDAIETSRRGRGRLPAASCAVGLVEASEVGNDFGVIANVYDPNDLGATPLGIGAALAPNYSLRRSDLHPDMGSRFSPSSVQTRIMP